MFIIIPLALILLSSAAIFFIIYKKLPQLKSASLPGGNSESAVQDTGGSPRNYTTLSLKFFNDFFPEIAEQFRKIKFNEYKNAWLAELEKVLRRLRVASLKIDRFSDHLIKKIRTVGDSRPKLNPAQELRTSEATIEQPVKIIKKQSPVHNQNKPVVVNMESLKSDERKLIIEIAKNPKDYRLYETLGDLYIKMNNFGDAKESYEAAMELNPHGEVLVKKHSQAVEKMIK